MTNKKRKVRKVINQTILNFVMIVSVFMVIYPLLMMIFGAFKSGTEFRLNKYLPAFPLRVSNIGNAFTELWPYLLNTIIVAAAGIIGMIIISSLASFSIARLRFRGSKICFAMVLGITMVPGVLSLAPQFALYRALGLQNNLFALIIPIWTGGCVGAVFLLSSFYEGLPDELFEAAALDGANPVQMYIFLGVPLSMPIIATLIIMQITGIWNDLLWPRLILTSEKYTISAGLAFTFETSNTISQTIKYAGYLVAAIPLVLVFIFFNRYYVEGLTSAGIKL